jgi:hypothetical protein
MRVSQENGFLQNTVFWSVERMVRLCRVRQKQQTIIRAASADMKLVEWQLEVNPVILAQEMNSVIQYLQVAGNSAFWQIRIKQPSWI